MTAEQIAKNCGAGLSASGDALFLDSRFRFMDRSAPVTAELRALCREWFAENGQTPPPAAPRNPRKPDSSMDPLDIAHMEIRLPPLPAVMFELQTLLRRPGISADQIAEVISKDPGLTAWLLRLVNSPYYGFSARVATVSQAVALVGTEQIQNLAAAGALNSLAALLPSGLLNMEAFWRHSVAVGIAAQEIWVHSGRSGGELAFVAGLLHDCGQLALAYASPQSMEVLNNAYGRDCAPTHVMERGLLGFDHARLGGILLHRWNMPLQLVIAVLRHHAPEEPSRFPEEAAVHAADILVTALGITTRPMPPVPPLSAEAWDFLGIEPEVLRATAATLKEKIDATCKAFAACPEPS